jgi:hypothetical protein
MSKLSLAMGIILIPRGGIVLYKRSGESWCWVEILVMWVWIRVGDMVGRGGNRDGWCKWNRLVSWCMRHDLPAWLVRVFILFHSKHCMICPDYFQTCGLIKKHVYHHSIVDNSDEALPP